MNNYLIYFDGLDQEGWFEAATEKEAYKKAFASLTEDERDNLECMDCIDVEPVAA